MIKFNPFAEYLEKSSSEAEAYELALGTYKITPEKNLLPQPRNDVGWSEFRRITALISSVGTKILTRKLDGIVGSFTHSGEGEIKRILDEEYDLRFMIDRVARDLIVKGSGALAIGLDYNNQPYVYRLGGFITKLYSEYDVDQDIGVLQIENSTDAKTVNTYEVRIFTGNVVQHWTAVRNLSTINWERPDHEYENDVEQIAFFGEYMSSPDGYSIGEIEQVAPLLKGIMATEAMIHRNLGQFAYPFVVMKGTVQWLDPKGERNPSNVLTVSEGGSVELIAPPSAKHLLDAKEDLFVQLIENATLPKGFMGKNPPSGEAVRESSSAFNASITRYARTLSRVFTNAFFEFFKSQGFNVDTFEIVVTPNILRSGIEDIHNAVELLEKGLLTPDYVIEVIQRHYDGISPERAKQILERYQEVNTLITPEDLLEQV